MNIKKIYIFISALLIFSIIINCFGTALASVAMINSFNLCPTISTDYTFEETVASFSVSEMVTESLGTQHTIKWKNPKKLSENMGIEIYAVVQFELYAPTDFKESKFTTFNQIENSPDAMWQDVDLPFCLVYDGDASVSELKIDYDAMLNYIYETCVESYSSYDMDNGSYGYGQINYSVINFINICSNEIMEHFSGDSVNYFNFCVNNFSTKYLKFKKMKYFCRYKKQNIDLDFYDEATGLYHYTFSGKRFNSFYCFNQYGESRGWSYALSESAVKDYLLSGLAGVSYAADKGTWQNGAWDKLDYKVTQLLYDEDEDAFTFEIEIYSPYPMGMVFASTYGDDMPFAGCVPRGYYRVHNNDGNYNFQHRVQIFMYNTDVEGYYRINCNDWLSYNIPGDSDRLIESERESSYLFSYEDSLEYMVDNGFFNTTMPILSPVFLEGAGKDYLITGVIDPDALDGGYYLKNGLYDYGPLLQNTISFSDGKLDESSASSSVNDGINYSTDGWLKKIYYRLGDILEKMDDSGSGDSSEMLEKIYKRLGWTNNWLAAMFIEGTVSDILPYALDFMDGIVELVSDNLIVTIVGDATAAAESITTVAGGKFPFSVIKDYYVIIDAFCADPECPEFSFEFVVGKYNFGQLDIEFSKFSEIAKAIKAFLYMTFVVNLFFLTRKIVDFVHKGGTL